MATNLTIQNMRFEAGTPPQNTRFMSAVSINCLPGFRFADFSQLVQITCRATGIWDSLPACAGE